MIAAERRNNGAREMTNENRELNIDELGSVTGGGIVDTVSTEAEASTSAFLKRFAEASQRFNAFINSPATQGAAAQLRSDAHYENGLTGMTGEPRTTALRAGWSNHISIFARLKAGTGCCLAGSFGPRRSGLPQAMTR